MISFLLRRQHNKHVHTFELGSDFDYSGLAEVFLEYLQQREAQLLVCDLAATEMDSRFDLVPVVKYPYRVVLLEFVVVLVGPRPELNLLDGNEGLFGLGFLLFLLLLVLILAEVEPAAQFRRDRGLCPARFRAPVAAALHRSGPRPHRSLGPRELVSAH